MEPGGVRWSGGARWPGGVSQVARWSQVKPGGVNGCFTGGAPRLPRWHPPRLPSSLHPPVALRVCYLSFHPPSFLLLDRKMQNAILQKSALLNVQRADLL